MYVHGARAGRVAHGGLAVHGTRAVHEEPAMRGANGGLRQACAGRARRRGAQVARLPKQACDLRAPPLAKVRAGLAQPRAPNGLPAV